MSEMGSAMPMVTGEPRLVRMRAIECSRSTTLPPEQQFSTVSHVVLVSIRIWLRRSSDTTTDPDFAAMSVSLMFANSRFWIPTVTTPWQKKCRISTGFSTKSRSIAWTSPGIGATLIPAGHPAAGGPKRSWSPR